MYVHVSYVMEFLACWYKIRLILSKMGFKEIDVGILKTGISWGL